MKLFHYAILLLMSMMVVSCINDENKTSEETTLVRLGDKAPNFTVEFYPSGSISLSSLQGEVVLLTFWDPECPTCRKEIAVAQQRIIDRFEGEAFHYLPIARGQDYNSIKAFFLANGYTFPVGIDPKREIYNIYASKYVPRSFIIDKQGFIRHIYVEYELPELNSIISAIEQMLE